MRIILKATMTLVLLSGAFLSAVNAQVTKEENLPQKGVLAEKLSSASYSAALPMPFGGLDPFGEKTSPITGGISERDGSWLVTLNNNSKERSYSVNVEFALYNDKGIKIGSQPYSYSLSPGQSVQRKAGGARGAVRAQLVLMSWKEN